MSKDKRLPWRCKSVKQARDKAEIYNSKEWKELRARKLAANPLCEKCIADGEAAGVEGGWIRSAHCVHHIVPIETATTKEAMRRLALDCGLQGLMSLCDDCHRAIHNAAGYHKKEKVKERRAQAFERWKDKMRGNHQTENPGASF